MVVCMGANAHGGVHGGKCTNDSKAFNMTAFMICKLQSFNKNIAADLSLRIHCRHHFHIGLLLKFRTIVNVPYT